MYTQNSYNERAETNRDRKRLNLRKIAHETIAVGMYELL